MTATITSVNAMLKDFYPLPGTRIKQYVVDTKRENEWERETCPHVDIGAHLDNTDADCRNDYGVPWVWLDHDCCSICGEMLETTRSRPDVVAWLAEKAARPPIESDHDKLSDEIAPDLASRPHPLLVPR